MRVAGRLNLRPSGENRIELVDPETCSALMVTRCDSAPRGTTSVALPTRMVPPSGPISAEALLYGSDLQVSRSTEPSTMGTRPGRMAASGAAVEGASGASPSEQPTPTRSTVTSITLMSLRFQRDIAHSGFGSRPSDDTAVGVADRRSTSAFAGSRQLRGVYSGTRNTDGTSGERASAVPIRC